MEFWGVEVKAGVPLSVDPEEGMILHLSQASLGEVKKDKANESVVLFVTIGDQKLAIGTLSSEKCAQISYDLVFEKKFELSHTGKNGSVYFCGYRTFTDDDDEGLEFDSDDEEEAQMMAKLQNGVKSEIAKESENKANAGTAAKPKVKIADAKKDDKTKEDDEDDDSDEDDDDEDDSEDDGSDDEDMLDFEDSDDDDEESSDEEEEATPKKVESSKKRPAESATKTPAAEKKAKLVTPQKTGGDGKKAGGHTATPHPSKKAAKNVAGAASTEKSKQQTPKSAGQTACKSCSKTFNSDGALQAHTKAKHSGGK